MRALLLLAWWPALALAAITVTFDRPNTRTDGSPLTQSEIDHYQVDVDGVTQPFTVPGTATSFDLAGLSTDLHCIVMRTVDTGGRMSSNSVEACKEGDIVVVDPPPLPPLAEDLSVDGWTATASSFEVDNWLMRPEYAFNRGDPNEHKLWHSQYTPVEAQLPHTLTVDLGKSAVVESLAMQPRAGGGNATIKDYEFHISPDGQTWERLAAGTAPPGDFPVEVVLDPLTSSLFASADGSATGRYIRLTVLSEQDGGQQGSLDELYVRGRYVNPNPPNPLVMVE